jgi:hypothetical protein
MKTRRERPFSLRTALGLTHPILGLSYTDSVPEDAATGVEGDSKASRWGCSMFMLSRAFQGDTVAFTSRHCQCPAASTGLGLAPNPDESFPGGMEAMTRYLSVGNRCCPEGRAVAKDLEAKGYRDKAVSEYLDGEGLKKTPGLVNEYLCLPSEPVACGPVAIIKPLERYTRDCPPRLALMLCDSLQLSALVTLANYARPGTDGARIPMVAGCASIAAVPLKEAEREVPRAVVGMTDLHARRSMRALLRKSLLSFAAPWSLYQEMEAEASQSFLSRPGWKGLSE